MPLKERIKGIIRYRHALMDMTVSQLKSKYAGSYLGIWWAVITPLILAVCINFVFRSVFSIKIPNYTLFVLSGIIPWLFFANTFMDSAVSFTTYSSILKQGIFPREIIPVSIVLSNLLNFLLGFVFMLPLFIMMNLRVAALLPVLAIIILLQAFFIMGLGLFFSAASVFLRDLNHLLSIGLMVWFWVTPVFYSQKMLNLPYRVILILNPMTYYVSSFRQILFGGGVPSAVNLTAVLLLSLVSFSLGYIFFLRTEPSLLKRI